jgi:hypothetical protein
MLVAQYLNRHLTQSLATQPAIELIQAGLSRESQHPSKVSQQPLLFGRLRLRLLNQIPQPLNPSKALLYPYP